VALGLPLLAKFRAQYEPATSPSPADASSGAIAKVPAAEAAPARPPAAAPSKPVGGEPGLVQTAPVRSGQQIYAENRDLTVVTAVGAGVAAVALEPIRVSWTPALAGALGYSAVLATAVALVWQMRAQRHMSSARAALIFCAEPVFAALASWVWFGERLSALQWLGGGLILAGMLLAEVPRGDVISEPV